jgi:hypothetical protein
MEGAGAFAICSLARLLMGAKNPSRDICPVTFIISARNVRTASPVSVTTISTARIIAVKTSVQQE